VPDELDRILEDVPVHAHVYGDPTHEELPRATPDSVLATMMLRHLGRPSTYGSHFQTLLA